MIRKVKESVYCLSFRKFGSRVYLLRDEKILIDTTSRENEKELLDDLEKLKIKPEKIKVVLLTHMHIDHIGNIFLFPNAKIYASKKEIEALRRNPIATVLDNDKNFIKKLLEINFIPLEEGNTINGIKVIEASGHTIGSLCFLYKDILFSGDVVFDDSFMTIGRIDLPTSLPSAMKETLEKLKVLKQKKKFNIICPGH